MGQSKFKGPYSGTKGDKGAPLVTRHPGYDESGNPRSNPKRVDKNSIMAPRADRTVRGGMGDYGSGPLPKGGR